MTTLPLQVTAANDDVIYEGGTFNASRVRFGNNGGVSDYSWMRFLNVTIASGSTVNTAVLTVRGLLTETGTTCSVKIYCSAEDSAAAHHTDFDTTVPTRTTASASWTNLPSFAASTDYPSPDFASVVQEVINRGGWASGNNLAVITDDNGSSSGALRRGGDYEFASATAPKLDITYTAGGGGATNHFLSLLGVGT